MNLLEEIEKFRTQVGYGIVKNPKGYECYKKIARHFYHLGLKASGGKEE